MYRMMYNKEINMVKKKNWIKLLLVLVLSIVLSILLPVFSIIDPDKIRSLGGDFQYNIISTSAIIGGFLFTGISILISAIDKERIRRLWENNYLDNLYYSAFIGMIASVSSICFAVADLVIVIDPKIQNYVFYIEIGGLIVGLVFFSWCIKKLITIVSKLKSRDN